MHCCIWTPHSCTFSVLRLTTIISWKIQVSKYRNNQFRMDMFNIVRIRARVIMCRRKYSIRQSDYICTVLTWECIHKTKTYIHTRMSISLDSCTKKNWEGDVTVKKSTSYILGIHNSLPFNVVQCVPLLHTNIRTWYGKNVIWRDFKFLLF